jgi:uncharacterized protein YndB with AHSA1/START domain
MVFIWEWHEMPERVSLVTFLQRPLDGGTELVFIREQLPDEGARSSLDRDWVGWFDNLRNFLETTE